jgi:D-tyrosyl-tRNA(Tyr) deacylase
MRAVVQRVKSASVLVDEEVIAQIEKGILVLLGIGLDDNLDDAKYLSDKVISLRIFEDEEGKMNKSLQDVNGDLLIVSQFTLMGDARKGRRPSFGMAARPENAIILFDAFTERCRSKIKKVVTGQFQAEMLVNIANDGPVTILLDSKKLF